MLIDKLKNNQTILKNTGYLSLIEVIRLIMPLIALPYIIRTIGTENYGMVAFAQTIISYLIIFINFGLDVSAVKNISVNRHNKNKLNTIVSSIFLIKVFLFFIALAGLLVAIVCFPYLYEYRILYLFSFLACVAEVLFPGWYYQGIEKMKYITFIRFISILFYTSTIFIFIRKYEDYIYVPLLQALGSIISSLLACYLLVQAEGVRWVWPRYKRVKFYFIDAIPFFFSRFSVVFNGGIARLMSGLFLSMHMVAAFDLAQKVATFALTPMQMSNQAAYPHIAKTKSKIFVKCFLSMNVLLSFIVSVSVFVLAPFITWYFAGDTLPEAVGIIRILCLYIFFAGMTTFLGAPVLVSFGISKGFNNSVIISSLLLAFLYALGYITNIFTIYHFAFAQCFAEFVILLIRGWYARKYHII